MGIPEEHIESAVQLSYTEMKDKAESILSNKDQRILVYCGSGEIMFFQEDHTYNDIRDKSLQQWLDEMTQHEDIAVRGGVKLCREYLQYLKDENKRLQDENELKNSYLKKIAKRQ
ncbi:MAG: rhodanese-like domain-containing protein [Lachnospiraceae bacterium]|nr:rhodanese-like domain-containing protein [Lachnospiraceae bacterium]